MWWLFLRDLRRHGDSAGQQGTADTQERGAGQPKHVRGWRAPTRHRDVFNKELLLRLPSDVPTLRS